MAVREKIVPSKGRVQQCSSSQDQTRQVTTRQDKAVQDKTSGGKREKKSRGDVQVARVNGGWNTVQQACVVVVVEVLL